MSVFGGRVLVAAAVGVALVSACGGSDGSGGDVTGGAGGLGGNSSPDAGGGSGDGGTQNTGGTGTGGGPSSGGISGSGGSISVPTGTPIPLSELGDAYETVVCEYLIECRRAVYTSVDACKADREPSGLADLEAAVSEGRVVYDAAGVGACRAAIEANLCNLFYLFVPTVPDVVGDCLVGEGRQTAGEPCRDDIECATGHYCERAAGTCPGECVLYAKEGDFCDDDVGPECEPPIELSLTEVLSMSPEEILQAQQQLDPIALRCIDGMCRTRSPAGSACTLNSDCLGGGWCDANNLCQPAVAEGDSCAAIDAECADGLFCDRLIPLSEGICRPLSASGGPCTFNGDCQGELVCVQPDPSVYGVCSAIGQEGDPCSANSHCAAGLACDNDRCIALPRDGSPCLSGGECAAGFTCIGGICVTVVGPDEPCNETDAICAGRCLSGNCASKAALDEPCLTDDECASQACLNGVCIDDDLCEYRNTSP